MELRRELSGLRLGSWKYKARRDDYGTRICVMGDQAAEHERTEFDVGKPVVHKSAFKQTTGEATYCDDIPKHPNELYLAVLLSKKTYAEIKSINYSKLSQNTHFFSAKNLTKAQNTYGTIIPDQEVFASRIVQSRGQVIGVVVAETKEKAKQAVDLVEVEYENLGPVVLTIEESIKSKSFLEGYPSVIRFGNVKEAFKTVDFVHEGQCKIRGQEHFYLETQCCLAVPKEDDELELFVSTQNPSETSRIIAKVLNIPANRITTKVRRIGGGFGGKETVPIIIAAPAALAAYTLRKPVRCMLDRDEDMLMTGGRHPCLFKYKVGFSKQGFLAALEVKIYVNAGYCHDVSMAVLHRLMFHIQNVYKIDNMLVTGLLCKTNLPCNVAFRGFGLPQALFAMETIIREVAEVLKTDYIDLVQKNMIQENHIFHYGQNLENSTLHQCLEECLEMSQYQKIKTEIKEYNRTNQLTKRGISIVPLIFGVGFGIPYLNQAGALVHVYPDGSVLLTHGGVEMGQGLHTKMIQIVSKIFQIPESMIITTEVATDKVPNTISTAASSSSDLNGMAILNACKKILSRLEPIKAKNPEGKWAEWTEAAFLDRISLSATGFYKTPDINGYDWKTGTGRIFNYYSFGAGCSVVEIDCLTGSHTVLRSDLVMDIGDSLNPAIDVGQIEGAFMQGYGLYCLEELLYTTDGDLLTKGPSNYKIPSISNVPMEFNVKVLRNSKNLRAIYSSKAVGEPPLGLSISVFFAIRYAIKAARHAKKNYKPFVLNSPATPENTLMAILDWQCKITNKKSNGLKK